LISVPLFNYSIYKIDRDIDKQLNILNESDFNKLVSNPYTKETLNINILKKSKFTINTSGQGHDSVMGTYYIGKIRNDEENYTVAVNIKNSSDSFFRYTNSDWKITKLTLIR